VVKVGKVIAGEKIDVRTGRMKVRPPFIGERAGLPTLYRLLRSMENTSPTGGYMMEMAIASGPGCGQSTSLFLSLPCIST